MRNAFYTICVYLRKVNSATNHTKHTSRVKVQYSTWLACSASMVLIYMSSFLNPLKSAFLSFIIPIMFPGWGWGRGGGGGEITV